MRLKLSEPAYPINADWRLTDLLKNKTTHSRANEVDLYTGQNYFILATRETAFGMSSSFSIGETTGRKLVPDPREVDPIQVQAPHAGDLVAPDVETEIAWSMLGDMSTFSCSNRDNRYAVCQDDGREIMIRSGFDCDAGENSIRWNGIPVPPNLSLNEVGAPAATLASVPCRWEMQYRNDGSMQFYDFLIRNLLNGKCHGQWMGCQRHQGPLPGELRNHRSHLQAHGHRRPGPDPARPQPQQQQGDGSFPAAGLTWAGGRRQ